MNTFMGYRYTGTDAFTTDVLCYFSLSLSL